MTRPGADPPDHPRVYTQAHMDVVAESVKACFDARESTRGLRMVYEPTYLRFVQARFEPI
ncbi:MAG TPA: hypothetical protein VJZ50_09715 [Candidatus Limnocylindrales bacterium]|nr:hypothetical protein [Candidatus Limnocylindrales bacterium]